MSIFLEQQTVRIKFPCQVIATHLIPFCSTHLDYHKHTPGLKQYFSTLHRLCRLSTKIASMRNKAGNLMSASTMTLPCRLQHMLMLRHVRIHVSIYIASCYVHRTQYQGHVYTLGSSHCLMQTIILHPRSLARNLISNTLE